MSTETNGLAPPNATHDTIWSGPRAVRDRRTPLRAPRVIAVELVTPEIRAVAVGLPDSARYVAAIWEHGAVVDVLSMSVSNPAAVPALRAYASRAADALGYAYYESRWAA